VTGRVSGEKTYPPPATGDVQVCNSSRLSNFRVSKFANLGEFPTARGVQPPGGLQSHCIDYLGGKREGFSIQAHDIWALAARRTDGM
jgi:hypothetical protein